MPPELTDSRRRPGRPPERQSHIADWLRRCMVEGQLNPGERLPSRRELRSRFGASLGTIQSALDQLIDEGFVESRSTIGTFVREDPPHLAEYVLVYPAPRRKVLQNRFWSSLEREAVALSEAGDCRVRRCYLSESGAPTEAQRELEATVQKASLRGLIFGAHPWPFSRSPIMTVPGVPRVALTQADGTTPQLATIGTDMRLWLRLAVARLAGEGRRRIGILTQAPLGNAREQELAGLAAEYGLETRPYWTQAASIDEPESARRAIHLLMSMPEGDRPDALLIDDDNLENATIQGILAAKIDVPGGLGVVAHCNYPYLNPCPLPVRRLGFDMHEILRVCLQACDAQLTAGHQPTHTAVKPIFDDTVHARVAELPTRPL